MLNKLTKEERVARTISGVKFQQEDFFYIIEDYINSLSEQELMGLYELEEDIR